MMVMTDTEQQDPNGVDTLQDGDGISLNGDHLSLVGLDLVALPTSIAEKYGKVIKHLDLSYNSIQKLDNLDKFVHLASLVVDNNRLVSEQDFPRIEGLKTLSVNNNEIQDLKLFIEMLKAKFPNLSHLSMLKNPACPNEFTGRDGQDYKRYRYWVIHSIQGLRFLDSSPVSDEERKEALRVGHLMLPKRPDPSQYKSPAAPTAQSHDNGNGQEVSNLPPELKPEGVGKASFGVSSYVYYGRQSEGNRFISNDDL